ncbi:hypothetical protein PCE1_002867 [Barthelona sp. PCE]
MSVSNWQGKFIGYSKNRNDLNHDPVRYHGLNFANIPGMRTDPFSSITVVNPAPEYSDPTKYDTTLVLDRHGAMSFTFDQYNGSPVPTLNQIVGDFVFPPQQDFFVYRTTSAHQDVRVIIMIDQDHTAYAWENGGLLCLKTNPTVTCMATQSMVSFDMGTPANVLKQYSAKNKGYSCNGKKLAIAITLAPSGLIAFGVGNNQGNAERYVSDAGAVALQNWFDINNMQYDKYLSTIKTPPLSATFTEDDLDMYQISAIMLKNAQNPKVGTFVASFSPSYGYKAWVRDQLYGQLALFAIGEEEALAQGIEFLAQAQLLNPAFYTTYDWFTGRPVNFVEPQFDSAGQYLNFVERLLPYYKDNVPLLVLDRSMYLANFLVQTVNSDKFGLGPRGVSIWEENSDPMTGKPKDHMYYTYTQVMAAVGLRSAVTLAKKFGWGESTYQNAYDRLRQGINDNMWCGDHYCRYKTKEGAFDTRCDSSTAMGVAFDIFDSDRQRVHMKTLAQNLTREGEGTGVARYWDDPFFYDGKWSPGGIETDGRSSPWPVTTAFTAFAEHKLGDKSLALKRRDWIRSRAAFGGIPVGECVCIKPDCFVWNSAPDVYEMAGVYVLLSLITEGMFELN